MGREGGVNTSIEQRVRLVAADVFGVRPEDLPPDASSETVLTWDSVAHLSFTVALEQEFGVTFDPDDLEHAQTVAGAVEVVDRLTRAT
jgi:acyl carrier protein